ncbi:hypothetical protein AB0940_33545 [Streptomyces sp. NPDC006656]|uniref:hypothetical protein n=1 Tax=Streptomyces sp. NPDC006656 TaxID=3156899 RepID=UPI003453F27E
MSQELVLAAITGSGLKGVVLPICASVLTCTLAVKAVSLSWSEDFNKKLSFFGGAVFSGIFVLAPDAATKVVTEMATAALG